MFVLLRNQLADSKMVVGEVMGYLLSRKTVHLENPYAITRQFFSATLGAYEHQYRQ